MKNATLTSTNEYSPFLASYIQRFEAFANSALADQRFVSIIDFLDFINQKANEIVSQAAKEGIEDICQLQMEIFDLARQYAGRYGFA
jgi:hypothetical protein